VSRRVRAIAARTATQHLPEFGDLRIDPLILLFEAGDGGSDKFVIESCGHRVDDYCTA
jgi:hypothetical protein